MWTESIYDVWTQLSLYTLNVSQTIRDWKNFGTLAVNGCMGCYIWYSDEGTGRGRSAYDPAQAPPRCTKYNQPTHQRPVYQSLPLYNMVHSSAVLMCP